MRSRFLLDRNGGRQAFDQVDVRFFHQLQKLARISRQRFDVTTLAFRIERIEGQGRLAGAGQAGDHDQLVAGQIQIDVLEVVRTRTSDTNLVH
ncbi:hypothetical protein D3C81_2029880 [compost metagenome]